MLSYGFEEGIDYQAVLVFPHHENGTDTTKKDYALTIDTAKEISMLQRKKGKQARDILLNVKKKEAKDTFRSNKVEMALLIENETLKLDNERMKPRSEFYGNCFNESLLILGKSQKY
jgi:anti-repressor protein